MTAKPLAGLERELLTEAVSILESVQSNQFLNERDDSRITRLLSRESSLPKGPADDYESQKELRETRSAVVFAAEQWNSEKEARRGERASLIAIGERIAALRIELRRAQHNREQLDLPLFVREQEESREERRATDDEVSKWKADADEKVSGIEQQIAALLSPDPEPQPPEIKWQCSGCRWGFTSPWLKTCPACGRNDYWSGSVHPSAVPWDGKSKGRAPEEKPSDVGGREP